MISTPLIRGETVHRRMVFARSHISIRSPHTRGDESCSPAMSMALLFQSTPLIRGETQMCAFFGARQYFNPLPSCEGRPHKIAVRRTTPDFNPLPSYEGRRRKRSHERWLDQQFQSTPLMRGETARWRQVPWTYCHFNPLPSYEGRLSAVHLSAISANFNPLPSYEGRPKDCFRRCSS